MIWKTCSVRVASRPATAITNIAVSQPAIQAAALRGRRSRPAWRRFWPHARIAHEVAGRKAQQSWKRR